MINHLVILADDLTGAADCAGAFASRWSTVIGVEGQAYFPASVLSLNTESRHATSEQAATQVRASINLILENETFPNRVLFYKKIDSMLRGHPAIELAAMMDGLSISRALVCPAFPAQNRFTNRGLQWISANNNRYAIPLDRIFNPALCGRPILNIPLERVRQGIRMLQQSWCSLRSGILIADAETEDDLVTLAQAAQESRIRLLCGSAGLARALASWITLKKSPENFPDNRQLAGPVLVVGGSQSAVFQKQVQVAQAAGIPLVKPDAVFLNSPQLDLEFWASNLSTCLHSGQDVIFSTVGTATSPMGEEETAARLASVTRAVLESTPIGGLILTGGDVAMAVCRALEANQIRLSGEFQAGIPIGQLLNGRFPGLRVITKAGAFGEEDLLLRAIGYLRAY